MALKDLLNIVNGVSVIRTISTNDGMGGATVTTTTTILPLCALWQNSSTNKYIYDKYSMNSSHILCFEYGTYIFNTYDPSGGTVIETVSYNNEIYNTMGFQNNYMNLNEIVTMNLDRLS